MGEYGVLAEYLRKMTREYEVRLDLSLASPVFLQIRKLQV